MEPSEQKLILRGVAGCLYHNTEWSTYEENGKFHINSVCFQDQSIKILVISLISTFIEKARTASIVGFSEGTDQAVISFASEAAYRLEKPFFTYTMNHNLPLLEIPSNLSNCTLLLPYISYKEELIETLDFVEKRGGYVKQVITLVEEKGQAEVVCKSKKIKFEKITSLVDIMNSLRSLYNIDKIRVEDIVRKLIK